MDVPSIYNERSGLPGILICLVPYIITLTVRSVIIRKFALLSGRIGPVSGTTRSERRKRL